MLGPRARLLGWDIGGKESYNRPSHGWRCAAAPRHQRFSAAMAPRAHRQCLCGTADTRVADDAVESAPANAVISPTRQSRPRRSTHRRKSQPRVIVAAAPWIRAPRSVKLEGSTLGSKKSPLPLAKWSVAWCVLSTRCPTRMYASPASRQLGWHALLYGGLGVCPTSRTFTLVHLARSPPRSPSGMLFLPAFDLLIPPVLQRLSPGPTPGYVPQVKHVLARRTAKIGLACPPVASSASQPRLAATRSGPRSTPVGLQQVGRLCSCGAGMIGGHPFRKPWRVARYRHCQCWFLTDDSGVDPHDVGAEVSMGVRNF